MLRHLALSLLRESHVFRRTLATFSKVKSASTFWKVGDSETSEKSHQRKNSLHWATRLPPPPKMALNSLDFVLYTIIIAMVFF